MDSLFTSIDRFISLVITLALVSCAHSAGEARPASGLWTASYYGREFNGRPTASGVAFDMNARTAAHRSLPFGTRLHVTNPANGRSVVVTVNDRGPFVSGRDLDLSFGAAKEIGMLDGGTAQVVVRILERDVKYVREVKYSGGEGPFTLQIGSFKEKDNAARLRDILARTYKNVYLSFATVGGVEHFRVCVGKFETKAQAEVVARRLADEGYGVIIVTYRKQA